MNKKTIEYTLESKLEFNTSFTCCFCNSINNNIETIINSKHLKMEVNDNTNKDDNQIIFDKEKELLNNKSKNKFDLIYNNFKNNNYSLLKNNQCNNCNKLQPFAYNDKIKTKLIAIAFLYIVIILFSLLLNYILQPVMISLFNNVDSFFTSIFFFPSIFSIISIIFYLFDIKKINTSYIKDNKDISYPTISKDFKLTFNIFDYNKEDRLNKH